MTEVCDDSKRTGYRAGHLHTLCRLEHSARASIHNCAIQCCGFEMLDSASGARLQLVPAFQWTAKHVVAMAESRPSQEPLLSRSSGSLLACGRRRQFIIKHGQSLLLAAPSLRRLRSKRGTVRFHQILSQCNLQSIRESHLQLRVKASCSSLAIGSTQLISCI